MAGQTLRRTIGFGAVLARHETETTIFVASFLNDMNICLYLNPPSKQCTVHRGRACACGLPIEASRQAHLPAGYVSQIETLFGTRCDARSGGGGESAACCSSQNLTEKVAIWGLVYESPFSWYLCAHTYLSRNSEENTAPYFLVFTTLVNAPDDRSPHPWRGTSVSKSNEIASTFYSYFARRRTLAPCPKGLTVEYE